MQVPQSIIRKIVKPISKKTKLSEEVVTLIITIGVPIIWNMIMNRKKGGAKKIRR